MRVIASLRGLYPATPTPYPTPAHTLQARQEMPLVRRSLSHHYLSHPPKTHTHPAGAPRDAAGADAAGQTQQRRQGGLCHGRQHRLDGRRRLRKVCCWPAWKCVCRAEGPVYPGPPTRPPPFARPRGSGKMAALYYQAVPVCTNCYKIYSIVGTSAALAAQPLRPNNCVALSPRFPLRSPRTPG